MLNINNILTEDLDLTSIKDTDYESKKRELEKMINNLNEISIKLDNLTPEENISKSKQIDRTVSYLNLQRDIIPISKYIFKRIC